MEAFNFWVGIVFQDYLSQPSLSMNDKSCRKYQKELLLAHCNLLRRTLSEKGVAQCVDVLQKYVNLILQSKYSIHILCWITKSIRREKVSPSVAVCVTFLTFASSFDHAMQSLKNTATNTTDELAEMFTELKGHLYLYAGTLLLKMAHVREQQWRAVVDLAALCYLLAYQVSPAWLLLIYKGEAFACSWTVLSILHSAVSSQVPRPKPKSSKGEQAAQHPLDLLACDRQSQAGHMLLNLSQDVEQFVKDVVEAFGNRSGQGSLFDLLFGPEAPAGLSFIGNDDIRSISAQAPEVADLVKADNGDVFSSHTHLSLHWHITHMRRYNTYMYFVQCILVNSVFELLVNRCNSALRRRSAESHLAGLAVVLHDAETSSEGLAQAALSSPHP